MAAETLRRILVVAPHALDEALGVGGTMARHAKAGDAVETLVLFGDGTGTDEPRRLAAVRAAGVLGTRPPRFAGFVENNSDQTPLAGLVAAVESAVRQHHPQTIYVPWGGGLHNDHRVAFQAAATASRALPGSSVEAVYAYEILSSSEWSTGPAFRPVRFVEIGTTLEAKIAAIACYASDLKAAPHARSLDACRALALLRGAAVGCSAAEAFETVRDLVREV